MVIMGKKMCYSVLSVKITDIVVKKLYPEKEHWTRFPACHPLLKDKLKAVCLILAWVSVLILEVK